MTGTGTPKAGPAIYDLDAGERRSARSRKQSTRISSFPIPTPSSCSTAQKILIRNGEGTYTSINNAQWADNLPKLVQARIVQSFENARQLSAVSRPLDQLNPDYRLELGIRSFQIALTPSPKAVVDVTARLVSDKGAVADARIFTASAPAKSTEAPTRLRRSIRRSAK